MKVGNKIDQEEHREVGRHEAERYAEQNNCTYFETSAKDSTGINDAFESGIFHIDSYSHFYARLKNIEVFYFSQAYIKLPVCYSKFVIKCQICQITAMAEKEIYLLRVK